MYPLGRRQNLSLVLFDHITEEYHVRVLVAPPDKYFPTPPDTMQKVRGAAARAKWNKEHQEERRFFFSHGGKSNWTKVPLPTGRKRPPSMQKHLKGAAAAVVLHVHGTCACSFSSG